MRTFLIGMAAALVVALVAGLGLNSLNRPTQEHQSTEETRI